MPLRPYQDRAFKRFREYKLTGVKRKCFESPTGTGKSYLLNEMHLDTPGSHVLVPSETILFGLMEKLGANLHDISKSGLYDMAAQLGYFTTLTYRNRLLSGDIAPPTALFRDEAHHDVSDSGQDITALIGEDVPQFGVTASYFRGTPQGTLALHKFWGEKDTVITIPDAIAQGYWHLPHCETWPLVDDDMIEIENGQLVISQVTAATNDKIEHLIDRMIEAKLFNADGSVTDSLLVSMPSTECVEKLRDAMLTRNLKCYCITQDTNWKVRQLALQSIDTHAIIQIRAIGEGTDKPFKNMVDGAATLSPLLWLQRFGRGTRVSGGRYFCTNRNYIRHCYLLEGVAPLQYLSQGIKEFGGLSERASHRAFGMTTLGRLKTTRINLTDGLQVHMYAVSQMQNNKRVDYTVIIHPNKPHPFWFSKESSKGVDNIMDWGKWTPTKPPEELMGFKSIPANPVSPGQKSWWNGIGKNGQKIPGAREYGIDPEQTVDARTFQILPVLANAKVRLA